MTHKKPTWKDIKSTLEDMTSIQLRGILQDLYKFNAENKVFFHSRFLTTQAGHDYLEPYKEHIQKAISPKDPWEGTVKLSAARKAISEFKKANGNIRDTLHLMLYYVTCGNNFTLEFGDIDEAFYDSLAAMFNSITSTLIKQKNEDLAMEFIPLLEEEVKRVEWMGWGYGDECKELFDDFIKEFSVKNEVDA